MVAHFYADVTAVHFVGNCGGCAGTEKAVEDEVAGICSDLQNALKQPFCLWSVESVITAKKLINFFF
jgi:Fe-S cluster biogenesis protein NfuA